MSCTLNVVRDFADLDARLADWIDLSDRSGLAAPFCGPRTWVPWLRAFRDCQPRVFELRHRGRLVAVLPMCLIHGELEMAAGNHVDYQDLAAEDDEAAAQVLLAMVNHGDGMAVFPKVAAHSRLAAALADPRVAEVAHVQDRFWTLCPTSSFALRSGESFLMSLSARQRKDYRNAGRRIEEAAPEHVVEHWGPGRVRADAFAEAAELHRENQHRKEGASVFSEPGYVDFLAGQSQAGAPICLSLLREWKGGPLMAFALGYFANDTYYYYLTAYAGRHASCSPGRWLLADALRHWSGLVEGGVLRFDMLGGEEGYKDRWAAGAYPVSRVVLIPKVLSYLPRAVAYSAIYGLKNFKNRLIGREAVTLGRPQPAEDDVALPS